MDSVFLVYPRRDLESVLAGEHTYPHLSEQAAIDAAIDATGRDRSLVVRLVNATQRGDGRTFIAGGRSGVIVHRVARVSA